MPNDAAEPLIIVGASVRAAAQSSVRAGYKVWGADLFADADLCAIASATPISRYPSGMLTALADSPEAPWIYTGALENYPSLIQRISKFRTCWGNSAEVVRRVRDPLLLAKTLSAAGIAFPATFKAEDRSNGDSERWLLKPKRSGGGSKVGWLDEIESTRATARYFVQQYIPGQSYSAVYVAAGGQAALLGMTQQLLGTPWLGAQGFSYCGSLGPICLSESDRTALQHIGQVLSEQFGLAGLFGVDLVRRSSEQDRAAPGEFVVIEVNPRYTASIEVLERSLNFSAIPWHINACEKGILPSSSELPAWSPEHPLAKGILFAKQDTTFDAPIAEYVRSRNANPLLPTIADLPHADTPIACGSPIVTLFAFGQNENEAETELRRVVSEFEEVLYK